MPPNASLIGWDVVQPEGQLSRSYFWKTRDQPAKGSLAILLVLSGRWALKRIFLVLLCGQAGCDVTLLSTPASQVVLFYSSPSLEWIRFRSITHWQCKFTIVAASNRSYRPATMKLTISIRHCIHVPGRVPPAPGCFHSFYRQALVVVSWHRSLVESPDVGHKVIFSVSIHRLFLACQNEHKTHMRTRKHKMCKRSPHIQPPSTQHVSTRITLSKAPPLCADHAKDWRYGQLF